MHRLVLHCALMVALTLACRNPFAPPKVDGVGTEGQPVPKPLAPEQVLENFKYAYDHRDSAAYSDCLDWGFEYHCRWYSDLSPLTKREDVLITQNNVFDEYEKITLTWVDSPDPEIEEKNQDHPDETWIVYRQNYDLLVLRDDPPTGYQATGQQLMKFRRDKGKGRWYLVYWEDLDS